MMGVAAETETMGAAERETLGAAKRETMARFWVIKHD